MTVEGFGRRIGIERKLEGKEGRGGGKRKLGRLGQRKWDGSSVSNLEI